MVMIFEKTGFINDFFKVYIYIYIHVDSYVLVSVLATVGFTLSAFFRRVLAGSIALALYGHSFVLSRAHVRLNRAHVRLALD